MRYITHIRLERKGLNMKRITQPTHFKRAKLIEYFGNNRAQFQCPDGHLFKCSVMPKHPLGKYPSEEMCAFMARRWQNSGVKMDCPICKRERNAHVAKPFRQILNAIGSHYIHKG